MRLTQMTDYALRLLMHVAQQPPGRLCTSAEVARVYGLSEAHVTKITHQLGRAGWLTTVRGKGGGMRLARPASEIALGDVVRGLEPDFALVECLGIGNACVLTGQCRLSRILGQAVSGFLQHLDGYTLADLLPPAGAGAGAAGPVALPWPAAAARPAPADAGPTRN